MPAYPLHVTARRIDPPKPEPRQASTIASDVAILLSMHVTGDSIDRMEVHGFDGRTPRDGEPSEPAIVPPEMVFRAWLGMARTIAEGQGFPDTVRAFCAAIASAAREIGDSIEAQLDLETKPVQTFPGAPAWVHRCGDTVGVEICDAWSEVLGFDLRARIEAMPLGLQMEWQAYLAGFQVRVGKVMRRKLSRPTKHTISPRLANEIAGIVIYEIRHDLATREHPQIEATPT